MITRLAPLPIIRPKRMPLQQRHWRSRMLFVLAAMAGAMSAGAAVDPATVAAITRLETRWGEAFVKRDFGFIESIIGPEYALAGTTPAGDIAMMRRAEWMKNAK